MELPYKLENTKVFEAWVGAGGGVIRVRKVVASEKIWAVPAISHIGFGGC